MTSIHIGTKPYIRVFLERTMASSCISRDHAIGSYLLHLLQRGHTDNRASYTLTYSDRITLYLSKDTKRRAGGWLNNEKTMSFNKFAGELVKSRMRTHIATYLYFNPILKKAVEFARQQEGLDCDILSDEAVIKDFQRYRAKHGGIFIYKKEAA